MEKFTTRPEAIEQLIVPALGEFGNDYDIEAIADEVLDFDEAYDEDEGVYRLDAQGFYQCVDVDEFWAIVAKHERHKETYRVHVAEGEEWGDSEGKPVLSLDGLWEADLELPKDGWKWNCETIEAAVAQVLGKSIEGVTATPIGGNINGDTSVRNLATTSDEWEVVVR